MRLSRRAFACLAVSWFAWAFVLLHVPGPTDRSAWNAVLGDGDHWSHVGQTALFLEHGFDIYKGALTRYCSTPWPPAEYQRLRAEQCPADSMCNDPGASSRNLCVCWQQFPPSYPPGLFLYSLPETLLYLHANLSFAAMNLLSLLKYLAGAHLLLWILFKMVFEAPERDELPGGMGWEPGNPLLRWSLFSLLYLVVIKWTLDGFYDPLAIFPLFLAVYFLIRRRSTDAFLALSSSLFLQFRALWYLPVFSAAAIGMLREREWRRSSVSFAARAALSFLMIGLSLYAFVLIYPFLRHFPRGNPVEWRSLKVWGAQSWDLLLPSAAILAYLLLNRSWLMFATVAWQLVMIVQTLQIMPWHVLFLLPLFALARVRGGRGEMVAAWILYLTQAAVIFRGSANPLPGELVSAIASHWSSAWSHAVFTR